MGNCHFLVVLCLTWSFLIMGTHQLQSSQRQVLLQLRKHLEYPKQLEIWNDRTIDLCYITSSTEVNVTCQENVVTELRINGDWLSKVSDFNGFAIPSKTLSENFSMDSFVTTLARLNNLRVLSLVSLGIWGPLPDKIHRLWSLEYLDLSSNFLFGSVPPKISTMSLFQTLKLDDNYFNDTIPDIFSSMSNLTVLSLKNNQFEGPFPASIHGVVTLTELHLSGNEISGKVPDLSSLSKLQVLDLSFNKFDSGLPKLPQALSMVFLRNNSFLGQILHQYSQLHHLQHLDLSFNALNGEIPASLLSLPNITYLSMASNMLSGSLPSHLNCGSKLSFVDISDNRLTGELPTCLSTESGTKTVLLSGNCLTNGLNQQHPESYCLEEIQVEKKQSESKHMSVLVIIIIGALLVVVLLAFVFLVVCRRYCPGAISEQHLLHKAVQENSTVGLSSEFLTNARFISQTAKLGAESFPACRSFTLEELKEATNTFDNSCFMGEGSCGKLYKGRLENGTQVAIRCLPTSKKYSIRNLKLRLDLLSKLRHQHLVCLLGHCIDVGGRDDNHVNRVFLVYEFVPAGNFRASITENGAAKVLNWPERLAVLISVAKALQFLHTGVIPGFFNNRLKTNNILFNEQGLAKLSDYGLSIISEDGTNGGVDGEGRKSWQMRMLEDDVYSFGFILLESLVGPIASARREAFLKDELGNFNSLDGCKRLINPVVLSTSSQESLTTVITIINKCICSESWSRPSFEDILWNLQYATQIQATADGEKRSDV